MRDSGESCDDGNQSNDDGCSDCHIDRGGWECILNSRGTDECHRNPLSSITSVSSDNIVLITFSEEMVQITLDNGSFSIDIF